jgi:hypothetical protein
MNVSLEDQQDAEFERMEGRQVLAHLYVEGRASGPDRIHNKLVALFRRYPQIDCHVDILCIFYHLVVYAPRFIRSYEGNLLPVAPCREGEVGVDALMDALRKTGCESLTVDRFNRDLQRFQRATRQALAEQGSQLYQAWREVESLLHTVAVHLVACERAERRKAKQALACLPPPPPVPKRLTIIPPALKGLSHPKPVRRSHLRLVSSS